MSLNLHSPSETSSAINKTSVDVCTNVRFDDEENEKSQPPADGVNKLVTKEKTKRNETLFTESKTAVDRKTIVGVQCDSVLSESSNELSSLEASEISNKVAYLQHLRELSLSASDAARTGAVDVRLRPNISISVVSERFAETTGLSNKHNRAASTHEGVKRKQVGDEELDNKTLPRIGASGKGSKETSGRRPQGIEPVKLARETADKSQNEPKNYSKVTSSNSEKIEPVKLATKTPDKTENKPEDYPKATSGRKPQRLEPVKPATKTSGKTENKPESCSKVTSSKSAQRIEPVKLATKTTDKAEKKPQNYSKETSGKRAQKIEPVKLATKTADNTEDKPEDKPEDSSKVASGRRPQRLETVKPATRTSDKAENEPESYSRVTSGRRPQRKEPAKEMANKTQNTTSRAESLSTNQHITICKKERVTTCEVIPSELLGTTNSMLQTEESTVDHHLQTW